MPVDAAHETFVVRKIGELELKFGKFTPRDRAALLKDIRQRRRLALAANLDAAGIPPEQKFAELEAFDDQPPYGSEHFIAYVNTPEGQVDIHERAMRKLAPDVTALDGFLLGDGESLVLAADICGLVMGRAEPKGDGSTNPPAGEPVPLQGYGT